MSAASSCDCACPTPQIVQIPGVQGSSGAAGVDGADGVSALTLLTSALTIPALAGDPVSIGVAENSWAAIGQVIFVSDGIDFGTFRVTGLTGSTIISATWLDAPNDAAAGAIIGIGGKVVPSGEVGALAGALPNVFTDNTTGTASDILAVGTGKFTHSVYFRAVAITGNVLLYTYTPGFAFKIYRISASVVDAITTAARAATLTTAIAGTPTTGGVVTVSGTYALGAQQASATPVTAPNTGTLADAITVTASAVTAFAEGGFMLHIEIQNTDSANAVASLADHIDDLIAAL